MERISFQKLTAPGPSGERHEHAQQIRTAHHRTFVRRRGAAFDELTCQAYIGTLDPANRWILDTALT
eukprot:11217512-Lingulodinium_polyedra.AAC.1